MNDIKSQKTKLVFVTSFLPFGKGVELFIYVEALALIRSEVNLVLIPQSVSGEVNWPNADELLARTIRVPLFNVTIILNVLRILICRPIFLAQIIWWIIRRSDNLADFVKGLAVLPKSLYLGILLDGQEVQHIHAHSTTTVAVIGYILSQMLDVPWSIVLHSSSKVTEQSRRSLQVYLKSVQFLRSVDQMGIDKLLSMFGPSDADKLKVIHHGVNFKNIQQNNSKQCMSKNIVLIATTGTLRPLKGHIYALEACRLLLDRGVSNFRWTFYGEGDLRKELETRIAQLGLNEIVSLAGYVPHEHLMELYRDEQIDIQVLPSYIAEGGQYEGIPNALKEAMAYGVPVIGTDSGGTLELIGNGCGIVVKPKNSVELADAVENLIYDEQLRYTIGQRGKIKVAQEFDVDKNIMELLHVIKDIE